MDYLDSLQDLLSKWTEAIFLYLPHLILGIVVFLIFYFLATWFKKLSFRWYSKKGTKRSVQTARMLSAFIYAFLLISGIILALQSMLLESFLTKLLAGAGILGILAGFAFKDIVSNAFSGVLIKYQKPYKIGDWVRIQEAFGKVHYVGLISTTIYDPYGQILHLPNQLIYNNIVKNYSQRQKRAIAFKAGVSYGDDLEHVKRVSIDEVKKIKDLLQTENIDFFYTDIGGSSYNFMLRFWIQFSEDRQYLEAMSECIMRIKKRFEQENISLAYPVTTLDFGVKGGVNIFDKHLKIQQVVKD